MMRKQRVQAGFCWASNETLLGQLGENTAQAGGTAAVSGPQKHATGGSAASVTFRHCICARPIPNHEETQEKQRCPLRAAAAIVGIYFFTAQVFAVASQVPLAFLQAFSVLGASAAKAGALTTSRKLAAIAALMSFTIENLLERLSTIYHGQRFSLR
jgi:hypothetical protein